MNFSSVQAGLIDEVKDDLVVFENGKIQKYDASKLNGVDRLAVYFSAHWSPPCRKFTPVLVESYKKLKAENPNFELIFVSSDHSKAEMEKYMREAGMPWPAVPYLKRKHSVFYKKYAQSGIPNLVFIDQEGEVLASTFVDGQFQGPVQALEKMKKMLK